MEIGYFILDLEMEANRVTSAKTTQIMYNGYNDISRGIGYFKGTFSLEIKDMMTDQVLSRCVAHMYYKNHSERN